VPPASPICAIFQNLNLLRAKGISNTSVSKRVLKPDKIEANKGMVIFFNL